MSTSKLVRLVALKRRVALQSFRNEASRLIAEITRLDQRIAQVNSLAGGYRDHLEQPDLTAGELFSITAITARLSERQTIDQARREMLEVERVRVANLLVEKRREIDKLEDETKRLLRHEANERYETQQSLLPARRV